MICLIREVRRTGGQNERAEPARRRDYRELDGVRSRSFNMKSPLFKLFAAYLSFALVARAAETASGDWKWSITTQNGDTFESTAKLKQEGEKLTGTINGRFGESEITEGTVKGNEVTFKVK